MGTKSQILLQLGSAPKNQRKCFIIFFNGEVGVKAEESTLRNILLARHWWLMPMATSTLFKN
jgi:hypothetical protein